MKSIYLLLPLLQTYASQPVSLFSDLGKIVSDNFKYESGKYNTSSDRFLKICIRTHFFP
jgi:hypothetical protein